MKKISQQLYNLATKLMKTFDPKDVAQFQWKKYKSVKGDFRNVYFLSNTMINDYSDDQIFQNALNNGYLIFENGVLKAVHSKETIGKLAPEKVNENDVLIIGKFNDCYPCPKSVFQQKYKHVEGSLYEKLSNIIVEAYQNNGYNMIVKSNHGQQMCKSQDYIIKSDNDYNVVDKQIFEKTYKQLQGK